MKKVLIADDAAFMRMSIKNMLDKSGVFEVVGEAENGSVAVDKYKALKPDYVTMDITMPDKDGIEAIKEIKEFDPAAKILVVSSVGQERFVRAAVIAGASSFIVKPFKEELLVESLKKL